MLGEDNRYKVLLIISAISLFIILILVGVFYLSDGSSVSPGQGIEDGTSEENPLPDEDFKEGTETEENDLP